MCLIKYDPVLFIIPDFRLKSRAESRESRGKRVIFNLTRKVTSCLGLHVTSFTDSSTTFRAFNDAHMFCLINGS